MESKNENLKFKRIDADLSDSFKEETSKDELKDMTEKLSETFKDALGKENLTVNVEKLKDASISSMITLSEARQTYAGYDEDVWYVRHGS